jgi:hypothetical protein
MDIRTHTQFAIAQLPGRVQLGLGTHGLPGIVSTKFLLVASMLREHTLSRNRIRMKINVIFRPYCTLAITGLSSRMSVLLWGVSEVWSTQTRNESIELIVG